MSTGAPAPTPAPDNPIGAADRELEAWKRARLAHQRSIDYKMTGWLPGLEPEGAKVAKAKEAQQRLF